MSHTRYQEWLVTVVIDSHSQEWTWGRELFWMAIIAAHLMFPQGSWPSWNAKIAVEGEIVQGWLDKEGMEIENTKDSGEEVTILRKDIWEQFRQVVSLYYPCEVLVQS